VLYIADGMEFGGIVVEVPLWITNTTFAAEIVTLATSSAPLDPEMK